MKKLKGMINEIKKIQGRKNKQKQAFEKVATPMEVRKGSYKVTTANPGLDIELKNLSDYYVN